ncbi:MAG: biotin/lipoyl-binding protein [candidate division Zixibacteria bacterium]|nr:biotin/lipoyl-binding protein [candidate division Zixibacteria bacterium]
MRYYIQIQENEIPLDITEDGNVWKVISGNTESLVDVAELANGYVSVIVNGKHYNFHISGNGTEAVVETSLNRLKTSILDEREKTIRKFGGSLTGKGSLSDLKAPMPGLIVDVLVDEGQEFEKGQGLIIVEAMKMENELKAADKGKVKEIKATAGQAVEKEQVLIVFE